MRIHKTTKREYQKKYLENCLPITANNISVLIENNKIILNFDSMRLVSSTVEEMVEKIKVALNK